MVFLCQQIWTWSAASIIRVVSVVGGRSKSSSSRSRETLQFADFLGHQRQLRVQVAGVDGTAGVSVVLRVFWRFLSEWSHSFSRLFTLMPWLCGKSGMG